jgi:hypothetical protein
MTSQKEGMRRRGMERGLGRLQECSEAAVLKYIHEVGGVVVFSLLGGWSGRAESGIRTYVLAWVGFCFILLHMYRSGRGKGMLFHGLAICHRGLALIELWNRPPGCRILPWPVLGCLNCYPLRCTGLSSLVYQREKYKRSQQQGGRSFVICEWVVFHLEYNIIGIECLKPQIPAPSSETKMSKCSTSRVSENMK